MTSIMRMRPISYLRRFRFFVGCVPSEPIFLFAGYI